MINRLLKSKEMLPLKCIVGINPCPRTTISCIPTSIAPLLKSPFSPKTIPSDRARTFQKCCTYGTTQFGAKTKAASLAQLTRDISLAFVLDKGWRKEKSHLGKCKNMERCFVANSAGFTKRDWSGSEWKMMERQKLHLSKDQTQSIWSVCCFHFHVCYFIFLLPLFC